MNESELLAIDQVLRPVAHVGWRALEGPSGRTERGAWTSYEVHPGGSHGPYLTTGPLYHDVEAAAHAEIVRFVGAMGPATVARLVAALREERVARLKAEAERDQWKADRDQAYTFWKREQSRADDLAGPGIKASGRKAARFRPGDTATGRDVLRDADEAAKVCADLTSTPERRAVMRRLWRDPAMFRALVLAMDDANPGETTGAQRSKEHRA